PRSAAPVQRVITPSASSVVTPVPPSSTRSQHVLVVDDNEAVRDMAGALLEEAGYSVTVCSGPEEALLRVSDRRVDLLVSDVSMPGMGGPELYDRLRLRFPGLRGLFMTGFPDRELIRDVPVLGKPFSGAQLVAQVRQVLGC
ncbi:MAG TPA: response regulator, partial [Planctomycetota bacterium]|nr:response regulator [Planctomycetota bacterium]